jgi:hypothetical protein
MRIGPFVLAALCVAILGLPDAARADVRVAPRVPAKPCSVEGKETAGTECVECKASKAHADRCDSLLSAYGYKRACRGQGLAWAEIWCRATKDAAGKTVPTEVLDVLGDPAATPKTPAAKTPVAPPPPAAPAPASAP